MSAALVRKDSLNLRRESLLTILLVVLVGLIAVSLATGLQRERVFAKERSEAEQTDKDVWMGQGDRNPHSAAHFSRYAFRPASPLALLDPGTNDFAGIAVWMEAHYQDPAVFRRAEDGGELSRDALLSPAFLLLTAAPLLVFLMLHASVAGEREDGTLRQLLATGVSSGQFFSGKLRAGFQVTMLVYTPLFAVLAAFSLLTTPAEANGDTVARLLAMYLVYVLYLTACIAVAIGVSAMFGTRQAAFLALAGIWALMAILMPRLASDFGTTVYPQPEARIVSENLSAAAGAWYADEGRQERIQRAVLEQYGVSELDDLPINWGAYRLQASEELSNPEFDRVYDDLSRRYRAQESVVRWFSILSPVIPAANLSRGVAGTDREHQREFTVAAELHRRDMIKLLNEDYMLNAGQAGAAYTADAGLWSRFEDFTYEPPSLSSVAGRYIPDGVLLLLWVGIAMSAANWSVRRAIQGEVTA